MMREEFNISNIYLSSLQSGTIMTQAFGLGQFPWQQQFGFLLLIAIISFLFRWHSAHSAELSLTPSSLKPILLKQSVHTGSKKINYYKKVLVNV